MPFLLINIFRILSISIPTVDTQFSLVKLA